MVVLRESSLIKRQFIHLKANWINSTPCACKCWAKGATDNDKSKPMMRQRMKPNIWMSSYHQRDWPAPLNEQSASLFQVEHECNYPVFRPIISLDTNSNQLLLIGLLLGKVWRGRWIHQCQLQHTLEEILERRGWANRWFPGHNRMQGAWLPKYTIFSLSKFVCIRFDTMANEH